ncbi:hypothetical protein NKG05_04350 [Oerskovia sp. M15]
MPTGRAAAVSRRVGSSRPGPTTALAWETILDLGAGPDPLRSRLERAVREAVHAAGFPPEQPCHPAACSPRPWGSRGGS